MSIRHKTQLSVKNMKTAEKKQLIKEVIEKLVMNGYDIIEFIGKPLSYWDYEKVKKLLKEDTFYKEKKRWRTNLNKWRALNRANTN